MSDWKWLLNNGLAIAVLVFLGIGMVAIARYVSWMARWIAPRIDRVIKANLATQEKLQASIVVADRRSEDRAESDEEHVLAVESTDRHVEAQRRLWLKSCELIRRIAPELIQDERLLHDVEQKIDEMERIIQEVKA